MALELLSLTRRYGRQTVLDDVSIRVPTGSCYGLLGHNGAGKTTALRIALGLIRADAGRVLVDGIDAGRRPKLARARMGGLVEVPGFYGSWSGAENLGAMARIQGLTRADARREATEALALVGLAEAGAKPTRAYSLGMRQRLGLAHALIGRPRYILLDEPTNGLDPEGIADIRDVLRRLAHERGATVLLSSHQLHEVADLCDYIGVMKKGRLVIEDSRETLLASHGVVRFETSEPERANDILRTLGATILDVRAKVVRVELGRTGAEAAIARLAGAGVPLRAVVPVAPTLEDVYLRVTRAAESGTVAAPQPTPIEVLPNSEATKDEKPVARSGIPGVLRIWIHDLVRLTRRSATPWLLLAPGLFGALAVYLRKLEADAATQSTASGATFSTTSVTAFEGLAIALKTGTPFLAILLASIASQAIASDLGRGTLRSILMRPVTRLETVLGKALAAFSALAFGYLALLGLSFGAAAFAFDFKDVSEVLPNGALFPLVGTAELWPEAKAAALAPLPVLAAYTMLGFAAGTLVRTSTSALGWALGLYLVLDLGRVPARLWKVEKYLPSAHLPSPLGDTSVFKFYLEFSQGVSNAAAPYRDLATPSTLVFAAVLLALAAAALSRREVS